MTRYVARNLRPKQLIWNKATQDRINRIVSVVSKVKIIKMLGLTNIVETQVSNLRQAEIDASKDMRWVSVLANASGMLPSRYLECHMMKISNKNSKCAWAVHAFSNHYSVRCCREYVA
jgi:hypothetical protein